MNDFFNVTNNIDIVIKCIIIIFTQITCYKIINDNKYITISKCVGYATSIILSILMKFIEYKTWMAMHNGWNTKVEFARGY